jgi:hypothetical protein
MTSISERALAAYKRATEAYALASAVAAKTGDPRHRKHAKVLRAIALERGAIYEAEFALQQIQLRERRNQQLTGKRLPPQGDAAQGDAG